MSTTHYVGTASVDDQALLAPTIDAFADTDVQLPGVTILQVMYETPLEQTRDLLPPGVHPSIPGHISWQVWTVPDSPVGSFSMAMSRLACRLGIKPRCLVTSVVVDSVAAAAFLAPWGYPVRLGEVKTFTSYDRIRGTASVDSALELDVELLNPGVFNGSAIRYPANLNLAHTPRGLRLVQADASYEFRRIERGDALMNRFDAPAMGSANLAPNWPFVATFSTVDVTLHEVRFISDPNRLASEGGTEVVGQAAAANGVPT